MPVLLREGRIGIIPNSSGLQPATRFQIRSQVSDLIEAWMDAQRHRETVVPKGTDHKADFRVVKLLGDFEVVLH